MHSANLGHVQDSFIPSFIFDPTPNPTKQREFQEQLSAWNSHPAVKEREEDKKLLGVLRSLGIDLSGAVGKPVKQVKELSTEEQQQEIHARHRVESWQDLEFVNHEIHKEGDFPKSHFSVEFMYLDPIADYIIRSFNGREWS